MEIVVLTRSGALKQHLARALPIPVRFLDMPGSESYDEVIVIAHRSSYGQLEWQMLLAQLEKQNITLCIADDQPSIDELLISVESNKAKGYCNSFMTADHYHQMVTLLASGGSWLPPLMIESVVSLAAKQFARSDRSSQIRGIDTLTEREQGIVSLLLEGKSNKDIAVACGITERTVKAHLTSIYAKAGVARRSELVQLLTCLPS